jgi:hypothetical protein
MEKQEKMNEEITQDVYFTRGYEKGYSDAKESLSRKMSKTIMDDHDAGYDQGIKDCHKVLKEQLDEMIKNCRFQDEYALKLVRDKLFNKND